MNAIDTQQHQLQGLALLLQLQRKARQCEDPLALGFTIVNETRILLPYRQAALWIKQPLSRIVAVSGVAHQESNAPYVTWLRGVAEQLVEQTGNAASQVFQANELPDVWAGQWTDWAAPFGLWLKLGSVRIPDNIGGLLLFRDSPWQEAEITLLAELVDAYSHAWWALQPQRPWWRSLLFVRGKSRMALLLPLVLLWPVRLSVLAPAEVVAIEPTFIRAPLDGVVSAFFVSPNQAVVQEQPLMALENTDIANRLAVTEKSLAVAEAEYRSNAQQAVLDGKNKSELAVLKSKIEQHEAEVAYLQNQLQRSHIKSPHAGIVIFTDPQDWLGKPVSIGERILSVADPQRVELQIHLPVADLIGLESSAEVAMFLNTDPQHPLDGNVYYVAYQAEVTAENVLAYRVKAHLASTASSPRIGLKGTAKIYGEHVSLFYYLFRRPLAGLRQWLGL
ncbi:MAG: HlyD family efflux transporter periplasmic adaptor subunit [Methylomicrobium sp.]|nr:HlyD family efflux transporter periplasmic adaptor subunit [Methylomicrobium sp.]